MTTLTDRPNTALLVIDVQNDVMAGAHNRDTVVANIVTLVDKARAGDVPVVWVQHSADDLPEHSDGWRYAPELRQDESEPVVHKRYGDSCDDTDLEAVLAKRKVGRLIVAGAQTDACIRSTCTERSFGATTRRLSAMPTPPKTSPSGAHRPRTRSSTTRTSTGSTTPRPGDMEGP